jgi:hypothetical protein
MPKSPSAASPTGFPTERKISYEIRTKNFLDFIGEKEAVEKSLPEETNVDIPKCYKRRYKGEI